MSKEDQHNDINNPESGATEPEGSGSVPGTKKTTEPVQPGNQQKTSEISRHWPYYLLLLLTIIGVGISLYLQSPAAYRASLLRGSSVYFTFDRNSEATTLYTVRYDIEAKKGMANLTVEYFDPGAGEGKPGKKVTGTVEPSWYVAFFQYLQETGTAATAGDKGAVRLKRGTEEIYVTYPEDRSKALLMKFQSLEQTYGKNVVYNDFLQSPDIMHLAGSVDPAGNIAPTTGRTVFFNREDGELVMHRAGSDFELGKLKILATNADGLCLAVEMLTDRGNTLIYWEKRMLQNRQYPIVPTWETDPLYRRVFMTETDIFFTAPVKTGKGHSLMRYNYPTLKLTALVPSVDGFIKDVSSDGKRVLIRSLDGSNIRIYDGVTGMDVVLPALITTKKNIEVFSFYANPNEFIITDETGIKRITSNNKEEILARRPAGNRYLPLALSRNRMKLLFIDPTAKKYSVYDFASKKTQDVNTEPVTLLSPQFSPDGETLYFIRFNDLFRWRPGEKETV